MRKFKEASYRSLRELEAKGYIDAKIEDLVRNLAVSLVGKGRKSKRD